MNNKEQKIRLIKSNGMIINEYIIWINDKINTKYLETKSCTEEGCLRYINSFDGINNEFYWIKLVKDNLNNDVDIPIGTLTLRHDFIKNKSQLGIMIHHEYINRGYGKLSILNAIEIIKSKGITQMTLGVKPDNTSAIRLYNNLHFTISQVNMELDLK